MNIIKKSSQNYRKVIQKTRLNVPIPPLFLPPPTSDQFLQKFIQKRLDRERQYPPARTYYEHRQGQEVLGIVNEEDIVIRSLIWNNKSLTDYD